MVDYMWDGKEITAIQAKTKYMNAGIRAGHDPDELNAIWNVALDSEEARDTIFEVSEYHLEIDVD